MDTVFGQIYITDGQKKREKRDRDRVTVTGEGDRYFMMGNRTDRCIA